MPQSEVTLAAPTDRGVIGVYQLKRLWSRAVAARTGGAVGTMMDRRFDHLVLDALGLGLEQVQQFLQQQAPSFDEFERWIETTVGGVAPEQVARFNAIFDGTEPPTGVRRRIAEIDAMPPVLTADDLAHWHEHGYVIVPDAVPEESRAGAERLIWEHFHADPDDPESWYVPNDHGIMVQLFQHPALSANRRSLRVHKAFAQLWGTADLWASCDRVGFNVPERPGWMFRGPHMHWDVSLAQPIPFGTQGILYLTDTPAEQGAFTCVPGFHRRIEAWLSGLPAGADPRGQDLHALGSVPIAGRAGDLIIWDHRLPHAARPNRGKRPRMVQYINFRPANAQEQAAWR